MNRENTLAFDVALTAYAELHARFTREEAPQVSQVELIAARGKVRTAAYALAQVEGTNLGALLGELRAAVIWMLDDERSSCDGPDGNRPGDVRLLEAYRASQAAGVATR